MLSLENDCRIAVVGLGYVGLPLALAFSKHFETVGYDIDRKRIDQLLSGFDHTKEAQSESLKSNDSLFLTNDPSQLALCSVFIVTVPTPIDKNNKPDLGPLVAASELVGSYLGKDNVVIYESTVYPGATEEVCIPILEQSSGLVINKDFYAGYSPERINPGDKIHTLENIVKLTSGSNEESSLLIDNLYKKIIKAGTYRLPGIREAEAAKVIENVQRDVNIALMNELAQIFKRLNIDTQTVLHAANTKWNFLPFTPGLVGGHCIGIDPYYLAHKARETGYEPHIIPASREINEGMGRYIADQVLRVMRSTNVTKPNILIMGLSFKENCPDLRNTKVIDIYKTLLTSGANVDVFDPWVDHDTASREYGIELISRPANGSYDAIILAVKHDIFAETGIETIRSWGKSGCFIYDVKHLFEARETDDRL
jgi:UDP-N-acetyl-D-galactosamine dehydrogenase